MKCPTQNCPTKTEVLFSKNVHYKKIPFILDLLSGVELRKIEKNIIKKNIHKNKFSYSSLNHLWIWSGSVVAAADDMLSQQNSLKLEKLRIFTFEALYSFLCSTVIEVYLQLDDLSFCIIFNMLLHL